MTIAKIFTVTKDEDHLIEDFIVYHGYIFGLDNIIIIDNNSQNQKVHDIYKKYEVKVYTEPDYTNDGQGKAFTKIMSMYKDQCEFLIGLDSDEFIFYKPDIKNGCNKENIIRYLKNIPKNYSKFSFSYCYEAIVDKSSEHYVNNDIEYPARHMNHFHTSESWSQKCGPNKKFYRSEHFIKTNNGNHSGDVSKGDHLDTQLGIFHYNSTGFRRYVNRAYKVVSEGYKYINESMDLETVLNILRYHSISSYGFHKVRIYLDFLFKDIILKYFIKYIKRYPTIDELNLHSSRLHNMSINNMCAEIQNCQEAKANKDILFNPDKYTCDKLLYWEEQEDLTKEDVIKCSYISDILINNIK